ncbi:MAG: DNA primase [Patescibacteria group bacterium]|nr:DNA primase [Patescibacteria group bacterium]
MEDTIKEVKSRIDIVNLINEYVPLTKGGKNYKGLCPFHDEKTPSFMVSPELQIFKCFGCDKGGDAIKFIQEMEGLDFRQSLEFLAKKAGIELKKSNFTRSPEEIKAKKILEINQITAEYFHYILKNHKFGKKALAYLKNRGIKSDTISLYKLGYAPNSWNSLFNFLLKKKYDITLIAASGLVAPKEKTSGFYDRFRGRIIIPLRNERGEVVGFSGRSLDKTEPKYLNGPETLVFKKERFLFNLDLARSAIKKKKEAILVEGYFDVITPMQEGFKNIVASLGTSLTAGQLGLIKRFADTLLIFYDTDNAGVEATKRALNLASDIGLDVKVGILPDDVKDPDEAVRADKKVFEDAVKNAVSIYDFYFNYAKKKHNVQNSLEKKKAADFLLPIVSEIPHTIQKAHYIKELATLLDVTEETVAESLAKYENKKSSVKNGFVEKAGVSSNFSPQEYMLALILKAPKDIAQKTLYKLSFDDFTNEIVNSVFVKLKDYLLNKERFLLKNFCLKLDSEENKLVEKLHLMELPIADSLEEDELVLDKEIKKIFDIINKETLRRKLREVSRKMKSAESAGDKNQIKELQKEFLSLSGKATK